MGCGGARRGVDTGRASRPAGKGSVLAGRLSVQGLSAEAPESGVWRNDPEATRGDWEAPGGRGGVQERGGRGRRGGCRVPAVAVEDGGEASCGAGCARLVSWTWRACCMSVTGSAAGVSPSDSHSAGSEEVAAVTAMLLMVEAMLGIRETQ